MQTKKLSLTSGHSSKKDFTFPTPKASKHSNPNISSHVRPSEQEMEYNQMIQDAGL